MFLGATSPCGRGLGEDIKIIPAEVGQSAQQVVEMAQTPVTTSVWVLLGLAIMAWSVGTKKG